MSGSCPETRSLPLRLDRLEPLRSGPLTAYCSLLTLLHWPDPRSFGVSTDPLRFSPRRYDAAPPGFGRPDGAFPQGPDRQPGSPPGTSHDRKRRTASGVQQDRHHPGLDRVDQCGDAVRPAAKGPRRLPLAWRLVRPLPAPQLPRSRSHLRRIPAGWTSVCADGARQHRSGPDHLCLEHVEPRRDRAMARGIAGSALYSPR